MSIWICRACGKQGATDGSYNQHAPECDGSRITTLEAEIASLRATTDETIRALAMEEAAKIPEAALLEWRAGGSPTFQGQAQNIRALAALPAGLKAVKVETLEKIRDYLKAANVHTWGACTDAALAALLKEMS